MAPEFNKASYLYVRTFKQFLNLYTLRYYPIPISRYWISPPVPITMKSKFSLSAYSAIEHVIDIEGGMRTDMPDTVQDPMESNKSNSKVLPLL